MTDAGVDDIWTDWTIHQNTPSPSIGEVGDLIDVRYFEVGYSALIWHRDVFILNEAELSMDWSDWENMAIVCYRTQSSQTATAQTMQALHQMAHNPTHSGSIVEITQTVLSKLAFDRHHLCRQPSTLRWPS